MKAVILAGGLGSRITEETETRPKPMIEIGGRPILWHIMKLYSAHGIDEFVVCLGYKGYVIKEFFANYFLHSCDVTFDLSTNSVEIHKQTAEPWKVTLVDTGETSMTGARLARVLDYVGDEDFCFTYGDGVADVDVSALIAFHQAKGTVATVTAVQPPGRFGALEMDGERVTGFAEKPHGEGGWINGGFFVLSPEVRRYLDDDDQLVWERGPLEGLARDGELSLYRHNGFWQPMDTRRELLQLQALWDSGTPPWRVWT
jgi:glucose-1-phosphate cytidylyltransferase